MLVEIIKFCLTDNYSLNRDAIFCVSVSGLERGGWDRGVEGEREEESGGRERERGREREKDGEREGERRRMTSGVS